MDFRPLPAMHEVWKELGGKNQDPWHIAAWFESTSSFLGGRRPRDLIAHDAAKVIAAAKDNRLQLES